MLHASEQAFVRSGSPVVGPSYQQLCIAPSSVVQMVAFAAGLPPLSHSKLAAGSFARQSTAAVTIAVHQSISVLLNSHPVVQSITVLFGHLRVASVAQSVPQSPPAPLLLLLLLEPALAPLPEVPPVLWVLALQAPTDAAAPTNASSSAQE